jgi:VWFA-related protein
VKEDYPFFMRSAACLLFLLLPWSPLRASAPPSPAKPEFKAEIDVRLSTIVLRVVDGRGEPIRGLLPRDFRVRLGGKEVPVVAVDWISSLAETVPALPVMPATSVPETPAIPAVPAPPTVPEPAAVSAGKLVVLFVQADANSAVRTRGHLKTLPYVRKLLAALDPADRVAVVSFDSHLKLWQDFTADRNAAHAAVDRAIRFGAAPPVVKVAGPPSLAQGFDVGKAADIASPEKALAETAAALRPIGGEKVLIFLGWGLGRFGSGGTTMTPGFTPAIQALAAAHTSVFVLDVTEASAHDLEIGLASVAEATGGTYAKTYEEPDLAVRELVRTISGYYVLTLDPDQLPQGEVGKLQIDLRDKSGTVLVRPVGVR